MVANKKTSKNGKREYLGIIWIAPALIMMCIFALYPTVSAFLHSFTDWDGGLKSNVVFFQNYVELFKDRLFWISLGNVVILTVGGIIIGNFASIILCELMYNLKSPRLSPVYRFLFVLPAMVPNIIVMLLWQKLILSGSSASVMNTILKLFGAKPIEWLQSRNTVIVFISIFLYGFPWMGGTSFLIYLAGLNGIDESIIEASRLDGVSTFKRIFVIDLPMIKGQLKYFLVMGFIGGLQNYSMQYAITNGGPGEVINSMQSGTMVPGFYIYRLITGSSRIGAYGYASAMGMVLFIIIMIITVINNKLLKTEE